MALYDDLVARRNELQAAVKSAKKITKVEISDHIETRTEGNSFSYVLRTRDTKTNELIRTYMPKEQVQRAEQIANYDYALKFLPKAERELKQLNKLIAIYERGTPEQAYENLHPARRRLIEPLLFSENDYVEEWLAKRSDYIPEDDYPKPYLTDNGEMVRSKSEKIIADRLKKEGIPYKYENAIKLGGIAYKIDFTVLKLSTREEIYWEHFGLADDIGYFATMMSKIENYEHFGLYRFKNFITTYESKNMPISAKAVNEIIKTLH